MARGGVASIAVGEGAWPITSTKYCSAVSRGTGKTFLTNVVLQKVRQCGKNGLAVVSSEIAATLLNDEKTAHSTFKVPLTVSLEQQSVCSIRKNGSLGKLLQETSLIIWYEYTMSHRAHIEAVNRTIKDLRN
ncbi:hypothetical protein EVAR_31918_1 [Eumeta japonica]|uniref:ATP-dependent DNA helicase n=1 Tax=Eumeta variegata TaxID=151549 RepID=A0A4C1XLL4_EUMVA|nr:hypothetical protein EVAR_31918_1 [Eumeta japonica]